MKRVALAISLALGTSGALAEDLLEVYQVASANDPSLLAAQATRDANLEATALAQSQLLPYVAVVGDAYYNNRDTKSSNLGSYRDDFPSGNAGVQLTQPLYRKDLRIQRDQAEDQVSQAYVDYTTAEQDLIVRVTEAYFDVLSAQDTLTFSEANLKAIGRQLDQARQRFEVGLIAITDVDEAKARYDQSRAEVIVAQNDLDDANESLSEITGQPTGKLAELRPGVELKRPDPASLDEWTAMALQNNPSIISAKYDADIAKKEIERQDAGDSPALDLVGSYNLARSDARFGSDTNDALIGVQLSLPLYTGGGVQAATRQARFQYEAAQEVLEQRRRAVQTQVRNAYRGALATMSRVEALEAAVVSATSALEATEAGFEVGTRTLVDVLNRQSELFRARRDLAVTRYAYVLNLLSLRQAAGTLSAEDVERANTWLVQMASANK
jgi:outer membrane protein